ncbi:hypothetical protein Tco_0892365 [Tanacetum coccineum]|uniref:Uncharacterized protein n=1 Tax=Tanacetum coccineum TaxID=301880 RepID=A0ABQ5C8S2_9ASTR
MVIDFSHDTYLMSFMDPSSRMALRRSGAALVFFCLRGVSLSAFPTYVLDLDRGTPSCVLVPAKISKVFLCKSAHTSPTYPIRPATPRSILLVPGGGGVLYDGDNSAVDGNFLASRGPWMGWDPRVSLIFPGLPIMHCKAIVTNHHKIHQAVVECSILPTKTCNRIALRPYPFLREASQRRRGRFN